MVVHQFLLEFKNASSSFNLSLAIFFVIFNILTVPLFTPRPLSLRSTLGERFVIFGDPVVDGIPVHARREDSRFLVTWTGDVQNLRHFE